MRRAFSTAALAFGVAACGATPQEYRNEKELPLPPGEGMFGNSLTWELRRKQPPPAAPTDERQEFEEWRAWQDWKRRHP